ncbi:hypothetical protein ACRJ4B_49855 [Streptomyces sp. GTA36]
MTEPVPVDAYAAQAATGIRPGTIRVWLRRGKLRRLGYDDRGRVLVDLHEVEANARPTSSKSA